MLDQSSTTKGLDGFPVVVERKEAIVLFGRGTRQRLKPVGVMGGTFGQGPVFHAIGDLPRDIGRNAVPQINGLQKRFVNFWG